MARRLAPLLVLLLLGSFIAGCAEEELSAGKPPNPMATPAGPRPGAAGAGGGVPAEAKPY